MKPGTITWDASKDAAANARENLPALAAEYIAHGVVIATPEATLAELHTLRLATKHFRYTLEAFYPVYGKPLQRWLEQLRQVQTFLGEINDCRVAMERYKEDPEAEHFRTFVQARLETRRSEFLEYWRVHFGAPDRLRRWRRFLGPKVPALASGRSRQRSNRQAKAS
jgi:CHAD domain-containing protein